MIHFHKVKYPGNYNKNQELEHSLPAPTAVASGPLGTALMPA